jgi:hypothetical protein
VREHGHERFFAIGKTVGGACIVHDLLTDYHNMFSISDAIASFEACSGDTQVMKDVYEEIKMDNFDIFSDEVRERMRVRYDHENQLLDFPGGVLLMMALVIFNASVSFDKEGAQEKLEALTLSDYPGEEVTAFMADAQKKIKLICFDQASGIMLPLEDNVTSLTFAFRVLII